MIAHQPSLIVSPTTRPLTGRGRRSGPHVSELHVQFFWTGVVAGVVVGQVIGFLIGLNCAYQPQPARVYEEQRRNTP
jgi:hypothetical protein